MSSSYFKYYFVTFRLLDRKHDQWRKILKSQNQFVRNIFVFLKTFSVYNNVFLYQRWFLYIFLYLSSFLPMLFLSAHVFLFCVFFVLLFFCLFVYFFIFGSLSLFLSLFYGQFILGYKKNIQILLVYCKIT